MRKLARKRRKPRHSRRWSAWLLTVIMNPAMIVTVVLGLWLAYGADAVDWRAGWVHAKIAPRCARCWLLHALLAKWRKDFAADIIPHSERFFRIINEVPTRAC